MESLNLYKAALLVLMFWVMLTLILKLARLSTYLFYPKWRFETSLTVVPLFKVKSQVLSWALTILLMPVVIGLAFMQNPFFLLEYIGLMLKKESRAIMLVLIYFLGLSVLLCALVERKLPRTIYASKKALILDVAIYGIIFIISFVITLSITLS